LSPRGTSRQHLMLGFMFGFGELRTQPPSAAGWLGGDGPEAAKMASQIAGLRSVSLPSSPSDGPMPEDKEYWDGLALLYSAMTRSKDGDHSVAIEQYMALELRPENVQAYMGRADLYESMGERERAIADYQKALAVGPNMLAQFVGQCTDALKRLGTIH
jgi:tetratricopeptide (TPR) repeat protein